MVACKKDGPNFAYPPPVSAHAHNQPRQSASAAAARGSSKGNEDDAQSHSSESAEAPDSVVVRLPPPRADINFTSVFALSLSLLQQAAAAAAATCSSAKQASSLIDCIPGFEIVSHLVQLHSHFCPVDVSQGACQWIRRGRKGRGQ